MVCCHGFGERWRRPFLLASLGVLVSSCGEKVEESPDCVDAEQQWTSSGEVGVDLSAGDFCEALAQVVCADRRECCVALDYVWGTQYVPKTEENCVLYVQSLCDVSFAQALVGMEGGSVLLDKSMAAKCLGELLRGDAPCRSMVPEADLLPSCLLSPFIGQGKQGASCTSDLECSSGLLCTGSPKKCSGPPVEGQSCHAGPGKPCGDGLYCGMDSSCHVLKKGGADCELHLECGSGLYCALVPSGNGRVCAKEKPLGEFCRFDTECASGACKPGRCLFFPDWHDTCLDEAECYGAGAVTGQQCWGGSLEVCSVSGSTCFDDSDCSGDDEKCVEEKCLRACVGGNICEEKLVLRDFCEQALGFADGPAGPDWAPWW